MNSGWGARSYNPFNLREILMRIATAYFFRCQKVIRLLVILAAILLPCAMSGCLLESSFNLAEQSRVPKWFAVPAGMSRDGVTVTLNYYTTPLPFDTKAIIQGPETKKLVVNRKSESCPFTGYPNYDAVTANGITEILEFKRMEPIFYVNDDPAIRKKVLDCRKKKKN